MLDEQGTKNFFDQATKLWVQPELERRRQAGTISPDFRVSRCLIRLPTDKPPIVEFNEEVHWLTEVERADSVPLEAGDAIYVHQVRRISAVAPPEVDGKRVAFVYIFHSGRSLNSIFDFSPNHPDLNASQVEPKDWELGRAIADHLEARLNQYIVAISANWKAHLRALGLWSCPALIPYPLNKILNCVERGDAAAGRELLIEHCRGEFLPKLSLRWWGVKPFEMRRGLLTDALDAHLAGRYGLSIYALLPQVEGIVTDWLHSVLPSANVNFRQDSKTKQFLDQLEALNTLDWTNKNVASSVVDSSSMVPCYRRSKSGRTALTQLFQADMSLSTGDTRSLCSLRRTR